MKPKRFLPLTALAGIVLTCSLHAQNGTWNVDADGNWNDAANWLDSIIADGTGSTALFTADITEDRIVTLGVDRTIANITFTDSTTSSNDLTISGANTLTFAGATPTVSVTQAPRTLAISSVIGGSDGLRKTGLGTLTLNGSSANTFTGGVNVSGGTLALDYANMGASNNLIDSGNTLTLASGGVFTLSGNADNNSVQSFASTDFGFGLNTLNLAKGASADSVTLNLGNLTIAPGSITTIVPGSSSPYSWVNSVTPTSEIVTVSGIAGKTLPTDPGPENWINVNAGLIYRQNTNAGSARWVTVDNLGQLQALPTVIVALNAAGDNITNANHGYQISSANVAFTSTDVSFYGLYLNPNSNGRSLTLAENGTMTINGMIGLQASNASVINAGTGTSNIIIGSERNLVINMDNGGGVTINAPIADNGAGASSVTVMGTRPNGNPGTVILAGDNTFSGGLISSGSGLLRLNHSNAAGTGTITLASTQTSTPSTFTIGNGINVANPIQIQAEVGRNTLTSTAGSNTLSGDITINNNSGNIIIFNNAGVSGTTFTVGDATPNSTTITAESFGSQISFRAATDGALGVINSRINAPNADFNGNNNGNWTINSTGNIWDRTSITGASRFVLGADDALATGARIDLNGTGFVDLNGFNQTVAGLGGSSANGRILNNSSTADSTLTIAGLTTNRNLIGTIEDGATHKVSLVVNNGNAFTQTLSGTNTYTGDTTVSAGTLYVTGALSNSAATVEAAGAIGGSGTLGNGLTILAGGNLDLTGAMLGLASTGILSITGGTLTLGNLTFEDLIGWDWLNADVGTYQLIAGSFSVDFGATEYDIDNPYDFGNGKMGYFTSGSLNAVIIPEPSAALLGAFGALLLLRRRR